jgi:hypothetical protein
MSGLIWAGIGKGIADAGQTFGNYMAKDIESKQLAEREAQREERLLARQEALDQLKADREEAKAEALRTRVASEAVAVESRAAAAPARRDAAALGRDAGALAKSSAQAGEDGDIALSEDQLKGLMQSDPKLRESYAKSGIIGGAIQDKMDPRMRAAEDQAQAALEIGAHSSVIDAYSKKRKDVLDQIRLENTEKKNDQQFTATMAAITERGRQFDDKKPILQQNADANTTRAGAAVTSANRPRGSGSGSGSGGSGGEALDLRGLQTEATAASRAVEAARKSRDKQQDAVNKSFGEDKATAKAALDAANKKLAEAETNASQVNRKISEFNTRRSGNSTAPKTGDNPSSTSGTTTKNYSNLWK